MTRKSDEAKEVEKAWGTYAANRIRSAMKSKNKSFTEMAGLLSDAGYPISTQALRNQLSRGNFKASWFLHALSLLGIQEIEIGLSERSSK